MRSPSRYGGLAAVFVFGFGCILVGGFAVGFAVLGFVAFLLAVELMPTASSKTLTVSVGLITCSAVVAYYAISSELSGQATYFKGKGSSEKVTRSASPQKFRDATNLKWTISVFCAGAGIAAFLFRNRMEETTSDY